MNKRIHQAPLLVGIIFAMFGLTGCDNAVDKIMYETDIIAHYAPGTFAEVAVAMNPKLIPTEGGADRWVFTLPDNNGFTFSTTFTNDTDQQIFVNAQPFIDAGLDVTKLEDPYFYDKENNIIWVDIFISDNTFDASATESPEFFLVELLDKERNKLCYHMSEDHYMIHDVGGNMVDFARIPKTNDRDIILMLDPAPFIDAGLDTDKIEGWSFGPVKTHIDGRSVIVDKLILNYNLI